MRQPTSCSGKICAIGGCLLAAVLVTAGCGGPSGPLRYRVSGSVQYKGEPVPVGTIVFEPDSSKGNSGPACYAQITNGRYVSESGQGAVGGPHVVRIAGADGVPANEMPQGQTLFPEYQTTIDLPKADSTQDFVVPVSRK